MPITTLATVKGKLDVPSADTTRDAAITSAWNAAEAWVLRQAGRDLAGGSYTETHRNVQEGREVQLAHRPVSALTLVKGRRIGAEWTTLTGDLIDSDNGIFVIAGITEAYAGPYPNQPWIPSAPPAPWFAHRAPTWPVVQVQYTTSAWVPPNEVIDATAALAAYWFRRHLAGAATSTRIEGISAESFMTTPVPDWVNAALADYLKPRAMVVR